MTFEMQRISFHLIKDESHFLSCPQTKGFSCALDVLSEKKEISVIQILVMLES
jgi:uncharacterized protein YbaR (Trm112 family)